MKAKTTKRNKKEERMDNLDDIPIQEIALDIPIQITCKWNAMHGLWIMFDLFGYVIFSYKTFGQIPRWTKESEEDTQEKQEEQKIKAQRYQQRIGRRFVELFSHIF